MKPVAKSGESGIIKLEEYRDNDTVYKPVTDNFIEKVPLMQVFTADDISNVEVQKQADILNARYQKACKDLLREVQKYPVGTELSIVYDENMNPIKECGYIVGKIGSVKIDNPDIPYYALHNHPSGETLSPEDLLSFIFKTNQLGIGATGNNSNAYIMLKSGNSDNERYYDFIFEKISNKNFYNGYSYLEIKDGKLNISKLSDKQILELKNAIIKLGDECAKAGENFGYKYIYK